MEWEQLYCKHRIPFPISNENITNATTISSFNNNNFLWYYSEGTGIKATKDATANSDNYWWQSILHIMREVLLLLLRM